jgi:hypothetical protein
MTSTHTLKLGRIQYRCLRIVLGSMESTHVQTLEVIGGVPPLIVRFSIINHFGLFYYWAPTSAGAGGPVKVESSENSSGVQRGGGLKFETSTLSL